MHGRTVILQYAISFPCRCRGTPLRSTRFHGPCQRYRWGETVAGGGDAVFAAFAAAGALAG